MSEAAGMNLAVLHDPDGMNAALRDSIAKVLDDACDSRALHAFVDGHDGLRSMIETQATELGWSAVSMPAQLDGLGLGLVGQHVLQSELGRVCAPGSLLSSGVAIATLAATWDSPEAAKWLRDIASGASKVAIPADLSGATDLRAAATMLGPRDASCALVPSNDGGLVLLDLSAVQRTEFQTWDRTRELFVANLSSATEVASFGSADNAAESLLRTFSVCVAADSVGLARGIADQTVAYLKQREQFGRPIGSFQALKHRAVDLFTRIGSAEHLLAQAVEADAAQEPSATMWALLAKAAASETAAFVAGDCVQLHGGVGFTWEYDVHLFLKRARLNEMLVGTCGALRDRAFGLMSAASGRGETLLELAAL